MSTITEAKRLPAEDWANDYGSFHVYECIVDTANGRITGVKINRKVKDGESKDPTGEQVERKGDKWKVAVPVPASNSGAKGGGKSYEADPRGLRSRNASTALSYAKDLVIADKIELAQLSAYADKCYEFIENKAKVDS